MKRKFKIGEEYIDTLLANGPHLIKITFVKNNEAIGFETLKTKGIATFLDYFNINSLVSISLIKATKLTKVLYGLNDK